MNEKVSVVVPIYNVADFVEECIGSLLRQTYADLEIVLVNDGSTDDSTRICREYAQLDTRIVLVEQENQGLIAARKAGVQRATGEFVAYVDGDDWVDPDMYEHMVGCAREHGAEVVVGGHKEDLPGRVEILTNVVEPGLYDGKRLDEEIYGRMICTDQFSQFGIFSYVWGKLYRRELLIKHQREVDEGIHIGEDAACLYPLLLECESLFVTAEARYHYRQRTDSLIKTPERSEIDKVRNLFNFLTNKFAGSVHYERLLPQLKRFVLSLLIVRTDCGPLVSHSELGFFPFSDVEKGARVAVCGAGTFGQHLIRRLDRSSDRQRVAWVDELSDGYSGLGLPVDALTTIQEHDFDFVLVAYIDESTSRKFALQLEQLGVPPHKIARVDYRLENLDEVLLAFGLTDVDANVTAGA